MKTRGWKMILLLAALAASSLGMSPPQTAASAGESGSGIMRAAENDRLALDFDPQTAEVTVTDLSSGAVWRSNSADRDTDEIAKGMKKQDLHAQLLIDYVDPLNKPFQMNNYTGSIRKEAFAWKLVGDGVEVVFDFPEAGFTIPVVYSLKGDAFSASIDTGRIQQRDKFKIVKITLLPFFGAGSVRDEGYLFVPDGSGALIHFNNGKSIYRGYNERVYGGDAAIGSAEETRTAETIRLPVFGMKRNEDAMLAVIHEGAYQAGITADVSRKFNQYNTVSSYLTLIEFETTLVMEGSLNEKPVVRASEFAAGSGAYEVKYYFLSGDRAGYAGMAERYRQYLSEELGVRPAASGTGEHIPLQLTFLGAVKKKDTFLGIPYRTVEVLTSFEDVKQAAGRLKAAGIDNLRIRYEGWTAGGLTSEVPTSLSPERKLGGAKAFRSLLSDLKERGIAFYPVVDPVHLYRSGNGFNKFFDTAKGISRAPVLKYDYLISNGTRNRQVKPWYLLKPESVREAVERIGASAVKKGLERLAFQSIGSTVYSDFRRGTLSKNETGRIWEHSLASASGTLTGLSFDRANAYTFPAAETVTDVPLASSGFDVTDEAVPYYSIAISGLLPAFAEPLNLMGDGRAYLLKLIETGTYPSYRFIARDPGLMFGTEYDDLYSGDFDRWFDTVLAQYKELNESLNDVAGQPISNHEKVREGVYRTTFASGRSVVVNYSEETVTVGVDRIEPDGYRVY